MPSPLASVSLRRIACVLLLGSLGLATPAHADELPVQPVAPGGVDAEGPPPSAIVDVRAVFRRMSGEVEALKGEPRFHGIEGGLFDAWKTYVKRRVPGLARSLAELSKTKRYVVDPDTRKPVGLDPDNWTSFLSHLTKVYAGLANARGGYSKVEFSPKKAIHRWDRANPAPDLRKSTPAESALSGVLVEIRLYERRGLLIPHYLVLRHERLVIQAAQERAALEAAFAAWQETRKTAIANIHAHVEESRRVRDLEQERYTLKLNNLQQLLAAMQEAEEVRLLNEASPFSEDPVLAKQVATLVEKLRDGRLEALHYDTEKASRYSSLVRRGWMSQRAKLASAIKAAERRAKAAAAAAEAAAEAAPQPAVEPEGDTPAGGDADG